MLPVIWRQTAREDLAKLLHHIALENPHAARRLKARLESVVLPLSEHPYLYRVGELPGTREIVAHPNYVVVYRVAVNRVDIVNVLHARQEYP
ncbi:type II toxin-antitoxin system RelE/ParE family toxin [Halomonas sp. BLK-85]